VDIIDTVSHVLGAHDVPSNPALSLDDVLAADAWARAEATRLIETASKA
jgi:1-deoxy-D-xylulose-5-phosphate reductoisomerase